MIELSCLRLLNRKMYSFTIRHTLMLVLSLNVLALCNAYNVKTYEERINGSSLPVFQLKTQDNLEYTYHPVPSKTLLRFKVKASNDAHIILSAVPSPIEAAPVVEVFIGGWQNGKSAIRVNRTKPDKDTQDTPKILSGDEFRGFWISFDNNVIAAGKEGDGNPFVRYASAEPLNISYYGVSTGYGSHGEWIIEDERIYTEDSLEYVYRPIPKLSLDIHVRAAHNAHIALTSGPRDSDPMYEILLGGWENTASAIRYRKEKPDKVRADTASLLSPSDHRRFIISWNNGTIKVVHQGRILLEWTDPSPFAITHFGVRTAWGSQGNWSIQFVDNRNIDTAAPIGFEGGPAVTPSGPVTWVPSSGGTIPPDAIIGGFDNENIYVGRAHHEGALIPGKVMSSHGVCYVPWGGKEHGKPDYEILTGGGVQWVQSIDGQLPTGAIPGGNSEDGETLYIGRAQHEGTKTIGKVQTSHKVCYIPYGGEELAYPEYEVLVST